MTGVTVNLESESNDLTPEYIAGVCEYVYPDMGSVASSVWNFCARFLDVLSRGNQWRRREMSAVFPGYRKVRLAYRPSLY